MEGRGVFLRTGALIVTGLGLLIGIVWFLGGERFSQGMLYESYFHESVQGLEVGAPVKYRGVTVGRVTTIGLVSAVYGHSTADIDRSAYRQVFVRYLVDTKKIGRLNSLEQALRLGLRARITTQVLTGVGYLELDFVNPVLYPATAPPWTPQATYIPSVPSTFTQVQDAAQALLAKLDKIDIDRLSSSLLGLVDALRAEVTTGDLHKTLADADTLMRTANTAVQQADLPGLAANLRQTSTALRDLVRNPALRRTLANSATATARLATLTTQATHLIATLQSTAHAATFGAADLQARTTPILRDLQGTAENLRAATDLLRQYPAQLLSGPPPRDPAPSR